MVTIQRLNAIRKISTEWIVIQLQQQQQKQQEALTERVQSYSQKATSLGIKSEDLQVAGNTVAQFGIHEDLVQYILEEDQGPLITTYLSKNLLELEKLREMSPTQAAVYVATTVKQKAAALKAKTGYVIPAGLDNLSHYLSLLIQ